ncbi:FAD-dependent oxidoreductase [Granulicoccus phenolivorans]|uniref:FAD-dependent oxidoreductase n=1 Tax=Granulicoccus phenolivorans TaxID=266854 RepID=UPI0006877E0F|nr:FAD-dependent oxidoreductase [Granulicoccus phenolivorans]
MTRALIIGGGIAGPATALFLHRAGWEVEIFEARPGPATHGGLFLNVATNGLAVLDLLGLRDELLAIGHRCPYLELWSGRDRKLATMPNGPAGEPERAVWWFAGTNSTAYCKVRWRRGACRVRRGGDSPRSSRARSG